MTSRWTWVGVIAGLMLGPVARGQSVPAIPGGANPLSAATGASTAFAGGPAGAAAAAAQPKTIWGFFGLSKANIQACKEQLCGTQLGMMVNNLTTGPGAAFTGGLIPPCCPPVLNPAAIAGLPGGPQGAEAVAAKIKASEADAKARVAAIEYLGTVDCTHWPEATEALKNALRQDPSECVRFAAARVLNSGCCCSKKMIDALKVSVAGTDADGNPPETSPRVKGAAFAALQNCLMRVPEELPPEPLPVKPTVPQEGGSRPRTLPTVKPEGSAGLPARDNDGVSASYLVPPRAASYDERLGQKTYTQTVVEARQTLEQVARTAPPPATLPPGRRDLFHALMKAREDVSRKTSAPPRPATLPPGVVPAAGPEAAPPADPGLRPTSYVPSAPGRPAGGSAEATNPSRPGVFGRIARSWARSENP